MSPKRGHAFTWLGVTLVLIILIAGAPLISTRIGPSKPSIRAARTVKLLPLPAGTAPPGSADTVKSGLASRTVRR